MKVNSRTKLAQNYHWKYDLGHKFHQMVTFILIE